MNISNIIENCSLGVFTELGMIILITGLAVIVIRYFLGFLKTSDKVHPLLKALGESMYIPLQWLILGYGFILLLQATALHFEVIADSLDLRQLRSLYFTIAFFWLIFIWKQQVAQTFYKRARRKEEKALVHALDRISTILFFVIAGFFILDIFHVPIAGLLAFGGVGGLAISFAGSDVIKNLFGGLMIYLNRHFSVGDWIMSPNKNFEGTVEQIGWYMTKIRTFERRPTFIPNGQITDAIIENPSRMYNRRIKTDIGIRYDDFKKVKIIVDEIMSMLKNHPEIDQKQYLMVDFTEYGAYSLNINIYTFTKTTDWQKWRGVMQDVLIKAGEIIEKNGAEIAFPTNTVHLRQ